VTHPYSPNLPRFYCPDMPHPRLAGGERACVLGADETRHARKVLRLAVGAEVELFNGEGALARAQLIGYESGKAFCRVLNVEQFSPIRPALHIACAIPKGSHAEDMVNQLAQLGVDRFIPLHTQRSVVTPRETKLDRLQRHAQEAAKQCGRLYMMHIEPMQPMEQVLTRDATLRLMLEPKRGEADVPAEDPWADAAREARTAAIWVDHTWHQQLSSVDSVLLIIGPEGGWTQEELTAGQHAGFDRWHINTNTLRIETAAIAAAAIVRYLSIREQ